MGWFGKEITDGVATDAFTVVPSDQTGVLTAEGDRVPGIRAVFIATGGAIHYTTADKKDRTVTVPNNFLLECAITRIYAVGTAAANMIGFV